MNSTAGILGGILRDKIRIRLCNQDADETESESGLPEQLRKANRRGPGQRLLELPEGQCSGLSVRSRGRLWADAFPVVFVFPILKGLPVRHYL